MGNVDATHPDVGFVNGPVLTVDDAPPRAKACALKNRRLVAIGSNDDIRNIFASPAISVDPLEGETTAV